MAIFNLDTNIGLDPWLCTNMSAFNSPFTLVNKFGYNPDVDNGVNEDLWDGGGLYGFYPSTAEALEVFSDSSNDTTGSSGLLTVRAVGLSSGWAEITEDVTLSGTGSVNLSNNFIRLYRAYGLTVGAHNKNVGNIQFRIQSTGQNGTLAAQITAGDGQTLMAIYTVPTGKSGYFLGGDLSLGKAKAAQGYVYTRETSGPWRIRDTVEAFENTASFGQLRGVEVPAKTDIRIEVASSGNNTDVAGGFSLLVMDSS